MSPRKCTGKIDRLFGIAHRQSKMSNITLITGTMSSGKTTHLLQTHFNLDNAFPGKVMLINRNDRMGKSICSSRMGGVCISTGINSQSSVVDLIDEYNHQEQTSVKFLFIDEAQFLSIEQVEELVEIADLKEIEVFAYGLLTNYKGKLFEATHRLIEVSDKIVYMQNEMRCWCGKPASHNALFISGKPQADGKEEIIDSGDTVEYQVMCRKHFNQHREYQLERGGKHYHAVI